MRRMRHGTAAAGSDLALLAARLVIGGFLIYGVWDNIVSAERMAEFEKFLTVKGFALPGLMAPHVFSDFVHTPIVKNMHGDSSGVRGAARLF